MMRLTVQCLALATVVETLFATHITRPTHSSIVCEEQAHVFAR